MLTVTITADIPDNTYFTATDVEPYIHNQTGELMVFNGKGTRRSWGAPQVNSTVVINNEVITAVHTGFSHKHRGGQGWYYFVSGERKTWAQLADALRQMVLDNAGKAPGWAKTPGKLKAQAKKPELETKVAYKVVQVVGDRLISLYDGETVYQIGKRLAEKVRPYHGGGYYAYETPQEAIEFARTSKIGVAAEKKALLKVEISGNKVEYGNKIAATYIRPIELVEYL